MLGIDTFLGNEAANYIPQARGRIFGTHGPLLLARIPQATIGDFCFVTRRDGSPLAAQVVAFREDIISLAPLENSYGIFPGAEVRNTGNGVRLSIPKNPIGCVLDAMGRVKKQLTQSEEPSFLNISPDENPPDALDRSPITTPFITGIRSIDSMLTLGQGQRVGLFAGPGVGKSTLLKMIARNSSADVNVIGLVGERGREVNEFLNDCLGNECLKKSVVVVTTSDESPIQRLLAPKSATAIAEYFRNQGKHVLLLIDSLTRTARAWRELGLSLGEIPVRQGYTPSVYTELPKLLERAGTNEHGSITAVYSVLSNNEDEPDALGDEVKSLLDGHIVLKATIAQNGIRPAIDVLESNSRILNKLHSDEYLTDLAQVIKLLSRLKRDKDIVLIGGSPDRELEVAMKLENELQDFLTQSTNEQANYSNSLHALQALASKASKLM